MNRRFWPLALLILVAACETPGAKARADSLASAAAEQLRLTNQLAAQKDSLTSVVLDADKFISQIDSQISRVKGLPKSKRKEMESPVDEQLARRKELMERVEALVQRTRQTSAQLAESRRREKELRGEVAKLDEQHQNDEKMIADLNATIQRQTATIEQLQLRVDSLTMEGQRLGEELNVARTSNAKAYYIIGREKELIEKGVVVKEGGANLLVARVGRTVQPARALDPALFTPIDQREVHEIAVPDTTRKYTIVSRQSLDAAEVAMRDKSSFRGNLKITDADKFWSQSRYLIIVEH